MTPSLERKKADRRQSQRVPLLGRVTYEVSVHQVVNDPEAAPMEGQIQNVSKGGICMLTNEALANTQVVEIGLPLPVDQITTPTIVEVRWVRRGSGQDTYMAGLRFLL
jgi:c-di-GMP-binding flagellar brake protein YcgR